MKIALVLVTSILFFSCKKEIKQVEITSDSIDTVSNSIPVDSHNSQNSLDWQGTYKGVTPCADCEGIETEIVLNTDLTFTLKTKYLGKGNGKIFQEAGSFVWDKTGGIISLEGLKGRPSQYKVGENRLIQLDMKGNVITGDLAEKYVLTK
ncbi:MAG TPA: copper resistance protein NlpE [Flavobacterium sp.]|nr:copper resistance protein NlpE [Flavobacterium sp.]